MRNGFTLIELLVVISIIVVLLALLTPSLDRAIYQAQLAICGANLHGTYSGAQVYALDHKRRYPYRLDVIEGNWETIRLRSALNRPVQPGPVGDFSESDFRPTIAGYISIRGLLDPLCDDVDIAGSESNWVFSCYNLFFGWRYRNHAGMIKLGDRFGFTGVDSEGDAVHRRSSLLVGDQDSIASNNSGLGSSHPDSDGVLFNDRQDGDVVSPTAPPTALIGSITISWWVNEGAVDRGAVDHNLTFLDGSVNRYDNITVEGDSRFARAPRQSDNNNEWLIYLPIE